MQNMPLYKQAQFSTVLHINETLNPLLFMQGGFYGNRPGLLGPSVSLLCALMAGILVNSFSHFNRQQVAAGARGADKLEASLTCSAPMLMRELHDFF